jgi:hypothetical protein
VETGFIKIGGRLISVESEEGKEYLKWERKPNYNPDAPENRFPRMLYMANRRPDGVVSVGEPLTTSRVRVSSSTGVAS